VAAYTDRLTRLRALEALERRAKQFRSHENVWPFRVPHAPLALDDVLDDALADEPAPLPPDALKTRTVIRLTFLPDGGADGHSWEAWVISLPSGVMLYCDDDGEELRVLASAKRGNPLDADGFFLELLAETHGHAFGMEMADTVADRVRASIADRDFLVDVFVDLYEGTAAERQLRTSDGGDFRADVERWLARVWVPAPAKTVRRQPRRRDEMP
jgi:hypothetical protein